MGIHVNAFTEIEARAPGLRIRVAEPYIRVRKLVHGRPRVSAFYFVWFSLDDGAESIFLVEPRRPSLWADVGDAGIMELHAELQQLPHLVSAKAHWFFMAKQEAEGSLQERPVERLSFGPHGIVRSPDKALGLCIEGMDVWADEAEKAFSLADGVQSPWTVAQEGQ